MCFHIMLTPFATRWHTSSFFNFSHYLLSTWEMTLPSSYLFKVLMLVKFQSVIGF